MKTSYLLTYLGLVLLTLLSYFFSENILTGIQLAALIMGIVAIKFIAIGFQFMELNNANSSWKVLFSGFILLFSLLVLFVV